MAFGRLERHAGAQPIGEINMTPLIDVMLVLLVIFIIAAPLMASSLKLDLPKTEGGSAGMGADVLLLSIDEAGVLYVGDQPVTPSVLTERVRDVARKRPTSEVQLRADSRVAYGRVAEVIGILQQAGLSRIGFVTEAVADGPATTPAR